MLFEDRRIKIVEILLISIMVFFILFVGKPILLPLFFAIFIWYLINSIGSWYNKIINKKNKPFLKFISVFLGLLTFIGIIWLFVKGVKSNVADVVVAAPRYQQNFEVLLNKFIIYLKLENKIDASQILKYINLPKILSYVASGLTGFLTNVGMVIAYILFLFIEQSAFSKKLAIILNKSKNKNKVYDVLNRIDNKMKTYLRVKTFLNIVVGVLGYIVMRSVNLDFALFWAMLLFIMSYIPTFGAIISSAFPILVALVQFNTLYPFVIVSIAIIAIQVLIGNIIEPKLVGNSLNLSPMIIMISLIIWGSLWGIMGMFLGVPLMVCIVLALSEIKSTRPLAILMSGDGDI